MKKISVIVWASLACLAVNAQGTVNFANLSGTFNAPLIHSDGVSKVVAPYVAGLLGGPNSSTLTLTTTTSFLAGAGAGYFNGGTQTIPGVAGGGTAWLRVIVWDGSLGGTTTGATFEQAQAWSSSNDAWGQTAIFSQLTGDPTANPPTSPATLSGAGLSTFQWVPEPSSSALAGLGAALVLIFRRRLK